MYRCNGLIGLFCFMVIGWYTPLYADDQDEVPLLETTQFELLGTERGRLDITIQAGEMRQYKNGNVTLAGSVTIVLLGNTFDKEAGPIKIQADKLSYNKAQNLCMLAGNVLICKPEHSLTIQTEQLWYDTKQEIIFTELPIVITDKEHVLKGSGFRATRDLTKYTVAAPNGTVEIKQEPALGANPL
ncbi:LPS export ABC transporter periplasmic protein LptC [Cardinium endosymbiont of Philonthus spinipes]|uniref:LPS export ABC transporter periplasmic protein LptC n=1 Tax=Cardinium endosymbiont of Philonthus spinipes TaxID=3077941 RepID=UPI00313E067E